MHWESSRRPLYIKTVWRDGQHHVLLRGDEKSNASRSLPASPSTRAIRSATKPSSSRTVSSVKLFLTGVGSLGAPEHKLRRCKTSVKLQEHFDTWATLPMQPVTMKVCKEIFGSNKNLNLSVKSHSIDLHAARDAENKVKTLASYFNCNKCRDMRNNSLSERVMVWLDLASQNGNYRKETKPQPQRIVTDSHVPQKRRHTAIKSKTSAKYQLNVDCGKAEVSSHEEGTSHALQLMISTDSSIGDKENTAVVPENSVSEDDGTHQLMSTVEKSFIPKELDEDLTKNKISSSKRQLHIFLPNLPKKVSDCDSSILSSKISNSLQKSIYFRNI